MYNIVTKTYNKCSVLRVDKNFYAVCDNKSISLVFLIWDLIRSKTVPFRTLPSAARCKCFFRRFLGVAKNMFASDQNHT